MPQLLPSRQFSHESPLSDNDWRDYFQNGFCLLRNLLSSKDINRSRTALENVLDTAKQLAKKQPPNFDGELYHQGAKFVLKNTAEQQLEKLYRVCGCGSLDPVLLDTSRHPSLLCAFQDILLSNTFEHIICQFHAKIPGDNVTFQPHRDIEFRLNCDPNWKDVNHWGSYVVAVIAIDAAGPDNGGLYVVPGSHKDVSLDDVKPAKNHFNKEWGIHATCPTLAPGDAILMHPYLVHWSSANNAQTPRFSLLSGVCSIGATTKNYPGDCTNEILSVNS